MCVWLGETTTCNLYGRMPGVRVSGGIAPAGFTVSPLAANRLHDWCIELGHLTTLCLTQRVHPQPLLDASLPEDVEEGGGDGLSTYSIGAALDHIGDMPPCALPLPVMLSTICADHIYRHNKALSTV